MGKSIGKSYLVVNGADIVVDPRSDLLGKPTTKLFGCCKVLLQPPNLRFEILDSESLCFFARLWSAVYSGFRNVSRANWPTDILQMWKCVVRFNLSITHRILLSVDSRSSVSISVSSNSFFFVCVLCFINLSTYLLSISLWFIFDKFFHYFF